MSDYVAPLRDIAFVLNELAGLEQISKLPGYEDATPDTVEAILEEAGKFASGVLAPLNWPGDQEGCRWENGVVTTPVGTKEAYQQFIEAGWSSLKFPPEFGGQGLPKLVATPVMEIMQAANLGFSLGPMLTEGAIEALLLRGSDELKQTFAPKMVADVRRMLMTMKALTASTRAVGYVVGAALDRAHLDPDERARKQAQAFVDFMIPIHKGWATEASIEVATLGIQVHGGMGFIEETGAAQYLRDARITTIYEGTTGIQANDLIGRKIAREGGATAKTVIGMIRATVAELAQVPAGDLAVIRDALAEGAKAFEAGVDWIVANFQTDTRAVHAGAVPFLKLAGIVCGGWQMACAAMVAQRQLARGGANASFYNAKIATARFYADHFLAQGPGLCHSVISGAPGAQALADEQF